MLQGVAEIVKKIVRASGVSGAIEGVGAMLKGRAKKELERDPAAVAAMLGKEEAAKTARQQTAEAVAKAAAPPADVKAAEAREAAIESGHFEPGGIPSTGRKATEEPLNINDAFALAAKNLHGWSIVKELGQEIPTRQDPLMTASEHAAQAQWHRSEMESNRNYAKNIKWMAGVKSGGMPAQHPMAKSYAAATDRWRAHEILTKRHAELAANKAAMQATANTPSPPPPPPVATGAMPQPEPPERPDIAARAVEALGHGAAPAPTATTGTATAATAATQPRPTPAAPKLSPVAQVVQAALSQGKPEMTKEGIEKHLEPLSALYTMRDLISAVHELRDAGKLPAMELSRPAQLVKEFAAGRTEPLPEDLGELRKALHPIAGFGKGKSGYRVNELVKGVAELKKSGQMPEPAVMAEEVSQPARTLAEAFQNLIAKIVGRGGVVNALGGLGRIVQGVMSVGRGMAHGHFRFGRGTLMGQGVQNIRGGFAQIFGEGTAASAAPAAAPAPVASAPAPSAPVAEAPAEAGAGLGATALAEAGGPIGIAIAAVVALGTVTVAVVRGLHRFAESTLEARRALAKFNGRIGAAFAGLEQHEIMRNVRTGRDTAFTTAALAEAVNSMRDELRHEQVAIINLTNALAASAAKSIEMGAWLFRTQTTLGQMMSFFNWLMNFLGGGGPELPWTEFISKQAQAYKDDVKNPAKPLDPLRPIKPPGNWRGL